MCASVLYTSVIVFLHDGSGNPTQYHRINSTAEETRMRSIFTTSKLVAVRGPFDPYGTDTIVYMHIQKTGGSEFLEHLVTVQIPLERVNLSNNSGTLPTPDPNTQSIQLCRTSPTGGWKRSGGFFGNDTPRMYIHHELCPKDWDHPNGNTWLVSEKTTAWNCGVHPFYTDFKKCLRNVSNFNRYWRKAKGRFMHLAEHNHFHYMVMLRHPLLRYSSEYLQVARGACWVKEDKCGRNVTEREFNPGELKCPEDFRCRKDIMKTFLTGLTLGRFLRCTDSLSINRMTLSLANNELATCWDKKKYSREQRDRILIESAKSNLRNFSYFGLNEFFVESGSLFEETFGVVFGNPVHKQSLNSSHAGQFISSLMLEEEVDVFKKVVQNNLLDLELYEYALDIFRIRMRAIGKELDTDTLNYIQTLNDTMHRLAEL